MKTRMTLCVCVFSLLPPLFTSYLVFIKRVNPLGAFRELLHRSSEFLHATYNTTYNSM